MAKQRRGLLRSLRRFKARAKLQAALQERGQSPPVRRNETDLSRCRPVRAHSGMIKFCCPAHVRTCRLGAISGKAKTATGGEPMDLPQVQYLCEGLLSSA